MSFSVLPSHTDFYFRIAKVDSFIEDVQKPREGGLRLRGLGFAIVAFLNLKMHRHKHGMAHQHGVGGFVFNKCTY